jgi:hypothetical protein
MGGVVCLLHVILLQMILAAIEGLSSKNGSNKSAISKYMEGKFGKLPSLTHTHTLLTGHLARTKEPEKLIFLKNKYFHVDAPDTPSKRGHSHPTKVT